MPALEIQRLAPYLAPVMLNVDWTLHDPSETVDSAYFLEEGVCSIVVTMKNGTTVEAGLIGREGVVGLPALLGTGRSPNRAFMQLGGYGYSVNAKLLKEQTEASSVLSFCLQRAVQGFLAQTSQTVACNRVHNLEERLARWLMMCHDRLQSDRLPITHEFLAMMLGTHRSSVTGAAIALQSTGFISYSRGHVIIQDRLGLTNAACECYQVVHDEYVRLGLL